MLAHKAEDEALALASILAGEGAPPWGGPIPAIVYTEPELAWAGQTEDELKARGITYEKGQFPFAANGRALASGADEGWVKLLSSPKDRRLLGAVIVGRGASELISVPVLVMGMGGCADDIALTVHGHPTMSEITREAALSLTGRPLHRI
jgi:dihydrolipoamide dehydrogenase